MKHWLKRHKDLIFFLVVLSGTVTIFLAAYLAQLIFIMIQPGEAGVLYRRLQGGTELNKVYTEGLNIIFPWDVMFIYNIRLQERRIQTSVLSSDGLLIDLEVSVRFYPKFEELPQLHVRIGPDYIRKVVDPVTISSIREVIGQYRPEDLYKNKIDEFQLNMLIEAVEQNGAIPVIFEDIIIRDLKLPDTINHGIETKLLYEQQFLQYQYLLAKEKQEADRKRIEAQGLEQFIDITFDGSRSEYLKWKGIDATLQLAKSQNSKVVVIGNDGKSMPIILSAEQTLPVSTDLSHMTDSQVLSPNLPYPATTSEAQMLPQAPSLGTPP